MEMDPQVLRGLWSLLIMLVFCCQIHSPSHAQVPAEATPWRMDDLSTTPATFSASGFDQPDMQSLFFQGLPFNKHETRVFAYYGVPVHAAGQKVPAVVLLHGAGGTAFPQWVRVWLARGYAVFALDWNGTTPDGKRYTYSGPPSLNMGLDQIDWPQNDQWCYHAVADAIIANSFLRSRPEVDADHIGLIGISMGAYLAGIVAGVDQRFQYAIPVYGCGFLHEDSIWTNTIQALPAARRDQWIQWWDPSQYLSRVTMPTLWINGTNDVAFYLDSYRKSYRLTRGQRLLVMTVRMPHGHNEGWAPPEIYAFADQLCREGSPLPRFTHQGVDGRSAWAFYVNDGAPLVRAELNYTTDTQAWPQRSWQTVAAALDLNQRKVQAALPTGTTAHYFSIYNDNNLKISTEHLLPGELVAAGVNRSRITWRLFH